MLLAVMAMNWYVLIISLVSPLKTYLAVYNFISNMIDKSKYCSAVMKRRFNKELGMTKEDNEDFKNSTKYWICDNVYIDNDVKVRDLCHYYWKV